VLEKPADPDHAKTMLRSLSGNTHEVYTGVALIKTGRSGNICKRCTFFERTLVAFGALTEYEIDSYVDSGSPMDKAGAYGIQDDWGALFVERIDGDYYNVVGFPLYRFYRTLKEFAPEYVPEVLS
jgi:septum formation protein